jgi:hypothetical protein
MPDFLENRGLAFVQAEVTPPVVDPAINLPPDYHARVQALDAALRWTAMAVSNDRTERTLQRALDFHAFLIARITPDEDTQSCE